VSTRSAKDAGLPCVARRVFHDGKNVLDDDELSECMQGEGSDDDAPVFDYEALKKKASIVKRAQELASQGEAQEEAADEVADSSSSSSDEATDSDKSSDSDDDEDEEAGPKRKRVTKPSSKALPKKKASKLKVEPRESDDESEQAPAPARRIKGKQRLAQPASAASRSASRSAPSARSSNARASDQGLKNFANLLKEAANNIQRFSEGTYNTDGPREMQKLCTQLKTRASSLRSAAEQIKDVMPKPAGYQDVDETCASLEGMAALMVVFKDKRASFASLEGVWKQHSEVGAMNGAWAVQFLVKYAEHLLQGEALLDAMPKILKVASSDLANDLVSYTNALIGNSAKATEASRRILTVIMKKVFTSDVSEESRHLVKQFQRGLGSCDAFAQSTATEVV